jgi:polysaccharide biosynthesis protein PslH
LNLPNRPMAIFVGANVPPNRVGLGWVRRLARRAPELTFVVVGALVSEPCRAGNVIFTGLIADHRPYLRAADFALCPIRFGGGTKIKLLEYLAAGLPTLAFRESIHGTELAAGEHLVVVDENEAALVAGLRDLVGDRADSRRLGGEGRNFVVKHHDWRVVAPKLEAALLSLGTQRAIA